MARKNNQLTLSCDFETTTDINDCRVWAYSMTDLKSLTSQVGTSLNEFMLDVICFRNTICYFHNLKFDGEFIINWLFENGYTYVHDKKDAIDKSFTALISDMGMWYSIDVWHDKKNKIVTHFKDSLKIIPLSVDSIPKAFGLVDTKLKIDYKKYRPVGYQLTQDEIEYIKADTTIVAKALNIMFEQGMTKLTTSSNALHQYKSIIGKHFKYWFPIPDYDADIRPAYKGGWTYCNKKYQNKEICEGLVYDINSLYPSVMYNDLLPYGDGVYYTGEYKYDSWYPLYIQKLSCSFELKEGHLPTIQLKNTMRFIDTEYLESSNGEDVILHVTNIDLDLIKEHYNLYNVDYISGYKFMGSVKLFKDYIDKWNDVKMQATIDNNNGMRTIAKLMMNSLYGKFAKNPLTQSKYPIYEYGEVDYILGSPEEGKPIYIPVGIFITAYARNKTIRTAQSLGDRFIYADTDSVHIVGTQQPNIDIDNVRLGAWKLENSFTRAKFIRAKTYIEEFDGHLDIKCAGMPDSCHQYVTWENFKPGTSYPGKLLQQRVSGGVVLIDTDFTIKK